MFVKGGWAGGNATFSVSSPVRGSASTKEFVDGWTIGGELGYAFWPSVILGVEYQHITLDLANAGRLPAVRRRYPDRYAVLGFRHGHHQRCDGARQLPVQA